MHDLFVDKIGIYDRPIGRVCTYAPDIGCS